MVWIHGGGYVVGSKSTQGSSGDPTGLLKSAQQSSGTGAVFVSLNYRLGAFVSRLLTSSRARIYLTNQGLPSRSFLHVRKGSSESWSS